MRILTVLGVRPQFIKSAPVSLALEDEGIEEILLHTGQHYDPAMSDIFFDELNLKKPKYNLGVNGGGHGSQTGKMLAQIEEVLLEEKPDRVLVYGDTNSTLAGALAAAKLHIPVDHVEAGLRSFNKKMPEEINRIMADHVSSWLFTPTETATQNLLNEGFSKEKIKEVGDVMYDAVLHFMPLANSKSEKFFEEYKIKPNEYALCTIHRAENTDDSARLRKLFSYLNETGKDIPILLPIHHRTRQRLQSMTIDISNIRLIDPVGYLDMLALTSHAKVILTDSGGLQKEAYFMKKPCVVFRDQTEWVELIEKGNHTLMKSDDEAILSQKVEGVLSYKKPYLQNHYGDGKACYKITNILKN